MSAARRGRLRAQLARPVIQTFLATVGITAVNLITGAILARELGPSGRGLLAAAIIWPQVLRFLIMLGAVDAITYRAARPATDLPRLAGTASGMAAIQAAFVLSLGAIAIPLILNRYGDEATAAALISVGTVCIGTVGMYYLGILNARHRWATFNALTFLISGLAGAMITLLAILGTLDVKTTMLCYLAGVAPTTIAAGIAVRRMSGSFTRPDWGLARELLGYGVRTQFSMVRNPLSQQIDQLAVSLFLAPAQLGLYVVGYTITVVVGFVSAAFTVVSFPAVARAEGHDEQRRIAGRYLSWALLTAVVIAVPLEIFADPLLGLVFGSDFEPAATTTRILLGAAILLACSRVGISILNGLDRPGDSGIGGLLMMGGSVVGLAIFVPLLGLEGAAVGALVGAASAFAWSMTRVAGALEVRPWALLSPRNALSR